MTSARGLLITHESANFCSWTFKIYLSQSVSTILVHSWQWGEAGGNHTSHKALETSENALRWQDWCCLQVPPGTTSIFVQWKPKDVFFVYYYKQKFWDLSIIYKFSYGSHAFRNQRSLSRKAYITSIGCRFSQNQMHYFFYCSCHPEKLIKQAKIH